MIPILKEVRGPLEQSEESLWAPLTPKEVIALLDREIAPPAHPYLEGFDVVTFSTKTSAECSPLSCNHLASEIATNSHCLLPALEQARTLLESGTFTNAEPGPYRIVAVYSVAWPSP